MIRNTVLVTRSYYYPLGNTPAVSLTQDLPPEEDADILLLGCGDARNILFTCFADVSRKIDVTCCDIEPGIHARNILLYSLLIEDKENLNARSIWNIYYHWKLDKDSVELLETQIQKLLELSKSMDQWHHSAFGSSIRFCDERSLLLVRSYWKGFRSQGLSPSQKKFRQRQLEAALDRAKDLRKKMVPKNVFISSDIRCTCPALSSAVLGDLSNVSKQWWDYGTTPSTNETTQKSTHLNPAFLYTANETVTLHYGLSPLVGFHLTSAYVPTAQGSLFHPKGKHVSSTEHLVNCAKNHFMLWALAFRRAVENKSVIRIFCGDALAFGLTLRHCQLTLPERVTSMNLFCDNFSSSPLKLHHDYSSDGKDAAPLKFDVIDTSNLVDHLGPLNVVGIGSSLLKYNGASSLYTEMLVQHDSSVTDRLSGFFGVDERSMSLLFGLVLPDLFTNATDSLDFDAEMNQLMGDNSCARPSTTQVRSRLRWKQLRGCRESTDFPYVRIEAKELAKLLIQVHDVMFNYEDPASILNYLTLQSSSALSKQGSYNRLSFALLLNLLRATVVTDWDQCIRDVCHSCFFSNSTCSIRTNCRQDLLLQMRQCGVYNIEFFGPTPADVSNAVLAQILPLRENEEVPEQLCVTVRVLREKLKVFTEKDADKIGTPALTCTFEGNDPGGMHWLDIFSAVQITFGTWHGQTKDDTAHPYIEEDSSKLFGTSDMFVSVYVPTLMLLQSKQSVPLVKCGLIRTSHNFMVFQGVLSPDLYFSCNKMTDNDVFVTRYMPGMSSLPKFVLFNARQDKPAPVTTTLRLTHSGSKVDKVIQRFTLTCSTAKADLANPSSNVDIQFKSPLVALVSIGKSQELKFEFPVPVSPAKYKMRIARKSSYIEVEAPLFNPLEENAAFFILPTLIIKAPGGANIPMAWTSTRIDLDAMPPVDVSNKGAALINLSAPLMFSPRERRIRESSQGDSLDARTDLKDFLFSVFMSYTGLQGQQSEMFGLGMVDGGNQTLIFPSCLRLDVLNHTFVLDAAVVPLTEAMFNDPKANRFFQALTNHGFYQLKPSKDVNRAWKTMLPALVERCRTAATWKHTRDCEYIQAGEVPLTRGLDEEGVSSICSCGIGKFPPDYLKSQTKRLPELRHMVYRYGTRAAIGPIFVVPYVEDCFSKENRGMKENFSVKETCVKCGKSKRENVQADEKGLLACSRCKNVKYCSKECQKADWKKHKSYCVAA